MMPVLAFILAGIVVVFAGMALARYGDAIAEATGLGRVWIGSVLLAGATSLPELATGISAVRMGAVDLAVGDLFGAAMANMLILAVIDLLPPRRQVLRQATLDHALAAALAISTSALATVFLLVRPDFAILGTSPGALLIFFIYVAGSRAIYRHAIREGAVLAVPLPQEENAPKLSLRRAFLGFGVAALAILVSAPLVAWGAKGIAEMTGLGNTFVGTWLLGLATTLPELVTCVAAVRMGAFDLAVGNLFGSNAFNMVILLPLDLAQSGSIFAAADKSHAVSGLFGVMLMSLGVAAIAYRAKRRFAMIEPDSLLILVAYLMGIWMLYLHAVP
jgi:cation:H+ antiporter